MSASKLFSQTEAALILPTEPNGTVQLAIPAFTYLDAGDIGYELLAVFVQEEGERQGTIPVQGNHTVKGDYLIFSPFFPFERGITYVVRTKLVDPDSTYSYQSFLLARNQMLDQAKVVEIYPSGPQLPENLLRFYIYFNTPMKKGNALKYIHLANAAGKIDAHAFMEFKQELWSPDGKRLTILFDPGRIKRGVSTNRELGPALVEGTSYQLTISSAWQDVYGQELLAEITKEFTVVQPYRQQLNAEEWEIHKPTVNTYESLRIVFDRTIDHALAQSMIQIEDEENNLISGCWETLEQERQIQFIPDKTWQSGKYQIVIDGRLEDVAGNNLYAPLDQNTLDERSRRSSLKALAPQPLFVPNPMNPQTTEQEFVKHFIRKERRERSLWTLNHKKKRADFIAKFNHNWDEMLQPKDLTALHTKSDAETYERIKAELGLKDSDLCYVISFNELDKQFVALGKAFEECQKSGFAGLIIREDGKGFYLKTEQEKGAAAKFIGRK